MAYCRKQVARKINSNGAILVLCGRGGGKVSRMKSIAAQWAEVEPVYAASCSTKELADKKHHFYIGFSQAIKNIRVAAPPNDVLARQLAAWDEELRVYFWSLVQNGKDA